MLFIRVIIKIYRNASVLAVCACVFVCALHISYVVGLCTSIRPVVGSPRLVGTVSYDLCRLCRSLLANQCPEAMSTVNRVGVTLRSSFTTAFVGSGNTRVTVLYTLVCARELFGCYVYKRSTRSYKFNPVSCEGPSSDFKLFGIFVRGQLPVSICESVIACWIVHTSVILNVIVTTIELFYALMLFGTWQLYNSMRNIIYIFHLWLILRFVWQTTYYIFELVNLFHLNFLASY